MIQAGKKAGATVGLTALITATLASPATADELSRTDKLRVLYSNQFAFDRRGVPLITIGIAHGLNQVQLSSPAAIRVLPDGEDGSEVLGGKRWRVVLRRSRPAVVEHFIVLDRSGVSGLSRLQSAHNRWKARGLRPRLIEVGTIFGVKGRVFDNRAFVLADGPYPSAARARRRAEKLAKKRLISRVAVVAQLKRRPAGRLEAVDLKSGARVKVKDAIWFAPRGRARLKVKTSRGGRPTYWGQIYVTVDRHGKLAVVNAVPADRLLAGLVPAEIFPSAPAAALRAQAVAARGDLLAKIGTRHFADPYLICSWQHCQVYRGAGHEHPRTTEAISATKGLVLVRRGGGLLKAVYSAHCGGHTEDNDQVWPVPADPNLRGRIDGDRRIPATFRRGITERNITAWLLRRPASWCARAGVNTTKLRWRVRRSVPFLSRQARHLRVGRVTDIDVVHRGRSGRANLVRVRGVLGSRKIRGELRIRRLLGNLRSSMFIVRKVVSRGTVSGFEFVGGGWGHGVGMCQTGAIGMAKAKKSFKKILKHYYTNATVRRVY